MQSLVFFRFPAMHSVVVKCMVLDLMCFSTLQLLGFCIYENLQLLPLRIGSPLVLMLINTSILLH